MRHIKETTEPWSQLVDPILGQGSLHQLIDISRPITKSCQSILNLVEEEGWLPESIRCDCDGGRLIWYFRLTKSWQSVLVVVTLMSLNYLHGAHDVTHYVRQNRTSVSLNKIWGRFPRVFGDTFGEEFGDKFSDEFSESPNLVMN